eukprot:7286922-Heterocapsa_arctica.AAC.1
MYATSGNAGHCTICAPARGRRSATCPAIWRALPRDCATKDAKHVRRKHQGVVCLGSPWGHPGHCKATHTQPRAEQRMGIEGETRDSLHPDSSEH